MMREEEKIKKQRLTLVLFSDKASVLPESFSSSDSWEKV